MNNSAPLSPAQLKTLNQLDQMRKLVLEGKTLSVTSQPANQLYQILQADLRQALQALLDRMTPIVAFKQMLQTNTPPKPQPPPPTIIWKTPEGLHIPTKQKPGCSSERVVYKTYNPKVSKGPTKKSLKRSIPVEDEESSDDLEIIEEKTLIHPKKRKWV